MRGKQQTAKVSKVSYLLKAYEKCNKSDMKMKRVTEPRRIVVGKSAMRNLKAFMKTTPLKDKPDNYSTPKRYYNPPSPKKRRSGRSHPSPMKADPFSIDTFTGKPPGKDDVWRKEALIELLDEITRRGIPISPFTKRIVENGSSVFKTEGGIRKMHRNWKSIGTVRDRGRPIDIEVKEAVKATKDALTSCSHDSSAFKLVHMKEELTKKDGDMKRKQLNAISYIWELCYDLLLATGENVSVSPGFEAFGLRVNR